MANQNTLADLSTTVASNTNWKGQSIQGTALVSTIDQMLQNGSSMWAAFYDSLGGTITAGGTATALTATITEDWAAYTNGNWLALKAPSAATGAATLVITVPTAGALASKKIRRQGDSAIQANDWVANATILLRYDSAYDTASGAWVLMNASVDTSSFALSSSVPAAAAQSDQETATSTTTYVSPGRQQFHPSAAKCWAFVTVSGGTPTLQTSYNITSITDAGAGDLTVTIATDFSSANWAPTVSGNNVGSIEEVTYYANPAAGTVSCRHSNGSGTLSDPSSWGFHGFGDQ